MESPKRQESVRYGCRWHDGSFLQPIENEYDTCMKPLEFCNEIGFISYILIDKDYVDIIALQEAFETFLHFAIAIKRMEHTRVIINPNGSNEQAKNK